MKKALAPWQTLRPFQAVKRRRQIKKHSTLPLCTLLSKKMLHANDFCSLRRSLRQSDTFAYHCGTLREQPVVGNVTQQHTRVGNLKPCTANNEKMSERQGLRPPHMQAHNPIPSSEPVIRI